MRYNVMLYSNRKPIISDNIDADMPIQALNSALIDIQETPEYFEAAVLNEEGVLFTYLIKLKNTGSFNVMKGDKYDLPSNIVWSIFSGNSTALDYGL